MPAKPANALDRILVGLKLKTPQGGLTREQAMQAWPVRNPALTAHVSDDGIVTVELPRRKDFMGGVLGFLFSVPKSKPVQLDEVGSFVWNLCDGEHTVADVTSALADEYKLNRREVELSLTDYLQTLAKRGIVAFAVPREVAEAAGMKGEHYPAQPAEEPPHAEDEAISDFHPEPPPTEPAIEETSGMAPVEVDEIADVHPYAAPEQEAPATTDAPTEQQDDQEHPGGV